MTDSLLIGRDHPASALRAAVDRTAASHGGLVLVVGEAGIGKTALVTAAAAGRRDELLVAFATSWESEAVPDNWLWLQVLRSIRGQFGEDAWRSLRPAPAIDVFLGEGDGARPVDFELHDAVTQLLISASRLRPLLIVLDDLHFSDAASLELLKFACQHTFFERILFVGTYRDSEIDPGHRLRGRMLQLVSKAAMVGLDGLGDDGVAALVEATVGAAPDPDTVAEITRRTGGNPFFVEQTALLWASGQPVDATSAGMRDALRRRIDQLPEPILKMLVLASVGGREFHARIMSQASGIDLQRIEGALDTAAQTRLVRRERDRYVFVHDLVRETLYNTMEPDEAAHHHGCVVRALVADESLQKHMLITEIAHHAWLAGDDLDPEIAVDLIARAGAKANACMSIGGAEKFFRRAVERCTPAMARKRVLLRIQLADAVWWLRREDEARGVYALALQEAEDLGDPMLLTRAAMGAPQAERLPELMRLKTLAYEGLAGGPPEPGLDHEALTRQLLYRFMLAARESGDEEDISFGLWASHAANWGPGTAAQRQEIVEELAEITRRTGDEEMRLLSSSLRWVVLLEQGDPAFLAQLAEFRALADAAETDHWRGGSSVDQAIIDMFQGRFDAAQARIDEAAALMDGERPHLDLVDHLRWELQLARGEAPDVSDVHRSHFGGQYADLLSGISALRRGEIGRARGLRDRLAAADGQYGSWESLMLRFEAELAAADGDADLARGVYDRLAPYPDEWLVAMWGTSIAGPVSYWLGVLAVVLDEPERAAAHFKTAAAQADLLDAAPWSALARAGLACRAAPAAPAPDAGSVFRREGATWTLAYAGSVLHLPHAKGLADLRELLSHPNEETAATDLLDPSEAVSADARLGGDDLLDPEARARFREHLETLDEQIDTAAAIGDDARAAALDAERQALIEHLKAATGLAGRSRRLGDNHERARKTVTNRIRNTLKKIEDGHPALGEHLRAAVTTGSSCAYRPGPDAPEWTL
ncbi:ATP-binding protein [Glycomyces artemisiae]|uniref:AAA ATPase-like protein n=1 Tax=Glycomyces artemisiae TaxID=1076443 RepID=A0A2T0UVF9_9ACTN|nr:AAA family ATPase [Glycomyces artemisiae]PRY61838.1 AAA ATPase-like protein [Glycomyces artemisiae]